MVNISRNESGTSFQSQLMIIRRSNSFVTPSILSLAALPGLLGLCLYLSSGVCASAEASIVAASDSQTTLSTAELERSYQTHSMRRNEIASRLSWLWREEGFLKEDYEYSGGKGDLIANRQDSRDIEQVRQEIDQLRSELSRENRAIQKIGALIPE